MGAERREQMRTGTKDKPGIGSPGTMDKIPSVTRKIERPTAPTQKSMLQTLKEKFQSSEERQQRALKDAQNFGKSKEI